MNTQESRPQTDPTKPSTEITRGVLDTKKDAARKFTALSLIYADKFAVTVERSGIYAHAVFSSGGKRFFCSLTFEVIPDEMTQIFYLKELELPRPQENTYTLYINTGTHVDDQGRGNLNAIEKTMKKFPESESLPKMRQGMFDEYDFDDPQGTTQYSEGGRQTIDTDTALTILEDATDFSFPDDAPPDTLTLRQFLDDIKKRKEKGERTTEDNPIVAFFLNKPRAVPAIESAHTPEDEN
jgi:hypothetical protein